MHKSATYSTLLMRLLCSKCWLYRNSTILQNSSRRFRVFSRCRQEEPDTSSTNGNKEHNYDFTSTNSVSNEEILYDQFKEPSGMVSMGKFFSALQTTGIHTDDPRLSKLLELLKEHKKRTKSNGPHDQLLLDEETFKRILPSSLVLITRAFGEHLIIPEFPDFCQNITYMYEDVKEINRGKVASYIPQLAKVDADLCGISICTIDGQRFSIGDYHVPFTIQSCSKPLTYAIALDKLGSELVHKYVGLEPSGRNFNELILDYSKKPHNPMINAGAIMICGVLKSLVHPEMSVAEKFDFVASYFSKMTRAPVGFNNGVFLSEKETGDRNYALGYFMKEHRSFPPNTNLQEVLDLYFQTCSMEFNCEQMALIAATLANGGVQPMTSEIVFKNHSIQCVLTLMLSCGMYDYSGHFAFKVGIPAKSGVSGCVILVIPNVMGICAYSPPLDVLGNSCRGLKFSEALIKQFAFHRYQNPKFTANKKDPTQHKYEERGLNIVNLLFSAATGDLSALQRHRLVGLDMAISDYDGRTALHLAAAEGHLNCVKYLLEGCKVFPNPKDRWGNTPYQEALHFDRKTVAQYLEQFKEV